jgi:transposase
MSVQKLKNRREFSPEFKLKIAVQVVCGVKTIAELSREHKIKDSVIARWRDLLIEHAGEVFQPGRVPASSDEQVARLERVIGQQQVEIQILKKASKRLL